MDRISVFELDESNNFILVDIRNAYYYNLSHIEGAINIPYYNLLNNYNHYLDKDKVYYLYCDMGEQSNEIAQRLSKFGYNVYSIDGGYAKYREIKGSIL